MSNFKNYLMTDEEFKQAEQQMNNFDYPDLPKGTYTLKIMKAVQADKQYGDGINLTLQIVDGEFAGARFPASLFFTGKSEIGINIARHNLTSLSKIKGYFIRPEDLLNIEFNAYVSVNKSDNGKIYYNISVKVPKTIPEKITTPVLNEEVQDEDVPF
jgi:hypothetical protein